MLTRSFTAADSVELGKMYAHIEINFEDRSDIEAVIDGDLELAPQTDFRQTGSDLVISCPIPSLGGFSRFMSTGMVNHQLILDGEIVDLERPITIQLLLPHGTAINASRMVGSLKLGGTTGDLQLTNNTILSIQVGQVTGDAVIRNRSVGKIRVQEIAGEADIHIDSTGDVTIDHGTTKEIKLVATSVGGFLHRGQVIATHLRIDGTGQVQIAEINGGNVSVHQTGIGNIIIKRGHCNDLIINNSGVGSFKFHGEAAGADLQNSGIGNIYVERVLDLRRKRNTGIGKIKIG